jgi:hypothetical protein
VPFTALVQKDDAYAAKLPVLADSGTGSDTGRQTGGRRSTTSTLMQPLAATDSNNVLFRGLRLKASYTGIGLGACVGQAYTKHNCQCTVCSDHISTISHPFPKTIRGTSCSQCAIDTGNARAVIEPYTARMNYVGRVMNRAARASQHTKTGQVWCTEKSWEAAERRINSRMLRLMGQMAVHNVGLAADAACRTSGSVTLESSLKTYPLVPTPPSASSPRKQPALPGLKTDAETASDAAPADSPALMAVTPALGGTHGHGAAVGSAHNSACGAPSEHGLLLVGSRTSFDNSSAVHNR